MTATSEKSPDLTRPASENSGWYVYAVCRDLDANALDGSLGLGGMPVELVHDDELTAVVSSVPLLEYGPEALRHNLVDPAWLDRAVHVHDQVVSLVAALAATVPVRLATVCPDDDAVRARLRDWRIPLVCTLDRVEGCAEWRVKVVSTGNARADETVAKSIHSALSGLAVSTRELGVEDARLSGHSGVIELNAAYLVPFDVGEAFATRIAQLAADGQDVVVDGRGPRPPYAFAMLAEP
ncbi:GvpL/GvpF family gas vesicle protein [Nocardioides sp. CER19]|uniref:GvpL/GvpF family gas vesicle protein n=1 Tax=Nocardioides sp. CER19 TaxID=3038538 RepID=UPI0024490E6C|nr:GvpL/GvpF family gas vesicle protein [Nocardioides sp. CER19]MDH2413869.1 GvpL/GvpF family gas vesicle protein [Nocardioides sp. CER19]